jgi:ankyrin repeat protein
VKENVMATLPVRPDLDQLRRQAKDLLRAARSGDAHAADRMLAVSDRLTLSAARLALAREYGFASWARLREEVMARTAALPELVRAFCEASISDWTGRAVRMLSARPEIAGAGLAPAVVLGDVAAVQAIIDRDPAAATRPEPASEWTPLHAACGSRWHRLDPARAQGLTTVAGLLLDAGADATAAVGRRSWTPLRCAVAGVANPAIVRLLLQRGAVPDDHDLYLACFGEDNHESLRLLLEHASNVAETTALAAPISTGDTEGVRLLLQSGANPNTPLPSELNGVEEPTTCAAIRADGPIELIGLLLEAGADPNASGPDGFTLDQLAARRGRSDVVQLLRRYGARPSATDVDHFLAACLHADRPAAQRLLDDGRVRSDQLTDRDHAALYRAAEIGNSAAVRLMIDLGFPIDARGGDDGGTALHAAAYNGSDTVARVLADRGADLEARDTTWDSTPLVWAKVGSSTRPTHNPDADWVAVVLTLLAAGAATDGITLSADDDKPASAEVAQLLRAHGVPDDDTEIGA